MKPFNAANPNHYHGLYKGSLLFLVTFPILTTYKLVVEFSFLLIPL